MITYTCDKCKLAIVGEPIIFILNGVEYHIGADCLAIVQNLLD